MSVKSQIEALVAGGRTEEALQLLSQHNKDGILLQANYSSAKKQHGLGLIAFADWAREQAKINYSILEMAKQLPDTHEPSPIMNPPNIPITAEVKPIIFVSYNHADTSDAEKVQQFLIANNCSVRIDFEDMQAAESIEKFIADSIKMADVVLMLVSKNSLRSAWVSQEATITQTLEKVTDKILLPVSLDDAVFNSDFYFESMDEIEEKITKNKSRFQKAFEQKYDTRPFQDELNRLEDAKANLGKTLEKLKGVLVVDISGDKFDSGMTRVLKRILKG